MSSDLQILKDFCNKNISTNLSKLTKRTKDFFITCCFNVLNTKQGNLALATEALIELKLIKKITYPANKAQGIFNFQKERNISSKGLARTKWKKLTTEEKLKFRPNVSTLVYIGPTDGLTPYQSLMRIGVALVKVIDKKDLPKAQENFLDTLRNFPEYKRNSTNPDLIPDGHPVVYSLGGFAALGNPSSFHNPFVRKKRLETREALLPLFRCVINKNYNPKLRKKTRLEMLPDRMMYRYKSQAPSPESWHRDVTPSKYLQKNDEIYGGWLSLDYPQPQYFSFIPGSQLGKRLSDLRDGFASLSPEAIRKVRHYRQKVKIPPGYVIIFKQYILHEVLNSKSKHDMFRIFMGWRTTTSKKFLFPVMNERILTQGIFPLPSGNEPPVYSANHGSFFRTKPFKPIPRLNTWKVSTTDWSKSTFKKTGPTGVPVLKGGIIPRWMKSLKHYKFPLYPPYTEEEIKLYLPGKIDLE